MLQLSYCTYLFSMVHIFFSDIHFLFCSCKMTLWFDSFSMACCFARMFDKIKILHWSCCLDCREGHMKNKSLCGCVYVCGSVKGYFTETYINSRKLTIGDHPRSFTPAVNGRAPTNYGEKRQPFTLTVNNTRKIS